MKGPPKLFQKLFPLIGWALLLQGCTSGLDMVKGDEGMSFLEGVERVKVEFDRSEITVGQNREHCFSHSTFLKTRSQEWRKKWKEMRYTLYEPAFDSLLSNELRKDDHSFEMGTQVEDARQVMTVVVEHIYMGDLYNYKGPDVNYGPYGGGTYSYPDVRVDLLILFHREGDRENPQLVLRYDKVVGAPMSVNVDIPISSFLESVHEKLGRETGEYILNNF